MTKRLKMLNEHVRKDIVILREMEQSPRLTPKGKSGNNSSPNYILPLQAHVAGQSFYPILAWLRTEFAIDKPTQKLADVAGLSPDELVAEGKKIRGRKLPLSMADSRSLKIAHTTSIVPMQVKAREALTLETRLSDLVNEAYGLTPDEVALMWETAPPRMPIPRPKK